MKARLCATLLLTTATLAVAAPPTTNPADLEREIYDRLKSPAPNPIGQQEIDEVPLDAKLDDYFTEHFDDFEQLKQAAVLPKADWGEVGDISPVTRHLSAARGAMNLLWLKSRWDLSQRRPEAAIDDLTTTLALARHVGQGGLLICHLVQVGFESGATDRLAAVLPSLSPELVDALSKKLDALPRGISFAECLQTECKFGKEEMVKRVGQNDAFVASFDQFYDEIVKAADKAPAEFTKAVNAAVATNKRNPFIQVLAPSLERARAPSAAVEVKLALLRTAIEIQQKGQAALNASADPFTGQPFTLEPTANGYLLKSSLIYRDKPVHLQVGR